MWPPDFGIEVKKGSSSDKKKRHPGVEWRWKEEEKRRKRKKFS